MEGNAGCSGEKTAQETSGRANAQEGDPGGSNVSHSVHINPGGSDVPPWALEELAATT